MIKETVVTIAFFATLAEKHPQPDLLHKHYSPIGEPMNGIRVYGNIQVGQQVNNTTQCYLGTLLI